MAFRSREAPGRALHRTLLQASLRRWNVGASGRPLWMFDLQQAGIVVLQWREVKWDAGSQTLATNVFGPGVAPQVRS